MTFSVLEAVVGGLMIGAAAALLLIGSGRVAGISGILGRALRPERGELGWRLAFLAGLPLGAAVVFGLRGGHTLEITSSVPTLVVAGLLVGVGTQLGNGCTSGHGVCGIARGSRRSIAATATFMGVAALVVFATRHWLGIGA